MQQTLPESRSVQTAAAFCQQNKLQRRTITYNNNIHQLSRLITLSIMSKLTFSSMLENLRIKLSAIKFSQTQSGIHRCGFGFPLDMLALLPPKLIN